LKWQGNNAPEYCVLRRTSDRSGASRKHRGHQWHRVNRHLPRHPAPRLRARGNTWRTPRSGRNNSSSGKPLPVPSPNPARQRPALGLSMGRRPVKVHRHSPWSRLNGWPRFSGNTWKSGSRSGTTWALAKALKPWPRQTAVSPVRRGARARSTAMRPRSTCSTPARWWKWPMPSRPTPRRASGCALPSRNGRPRCRRPTSWRPTPRRRSTW